MNFIEKFGLILIIAFFTSTFSESWKGLEVVIFWFAGVFFFAGKQLESWLKAFRDV